MKSILISMCLLMLTACGHSDSAPVSTSDMSPAKVVFRAQGYYNAAVVAETAYDKLPLCPKAKPICSDSDVKKKVRKIDDTAWAAIKEAQKAVRTPGFGDDKIATFLTSATALTQAFTDITKTLPKKE